MKCDPNTLSSDNGWLYPEPFQNAAQKAKEISQKNKHGDTGNNYAALSASHALRTSTKGEITRNFETVESERHTYIFFVFLLFSRGFLREPNDDERERSERFTNGTSLSKQGSSTIMVMGRVKFPNLPITPASIYFYWHRYPK